MDIARTQCEKEKRVSTLKKVLVNDLELPNDHPPNPNSMKRSQSNDNEKHSMTPLLFLSDITKTQ